MNDTTKALLLKTRKGATAGFETKQWTEVLTALGFEVVVTKTRNTITRVVIHAPNRNTLVIDKVSGYKRVVFYDLCRWIKSEQVGLDLVELASRALGMETPENEKKLHDLYIRDLTNTGTCPVCGGNYKLDGAGIGHHGFRRPGDGMLHGSCFGVAYLPWEQSAEGALAYLDQVLKPALNRAEAFLAELPNKTTLPREVYLGKGAYRMEYIGKTEENRYEFDCLMRSELYKAEAEVRHLRSEVAGFEKKTANWREDVLPEIKYAGKFKKA